MLSAPPGDAEPDSGFCGSDAPPGLASSGMIESELKFQGYHTRKISVNCPKFANTRRHPVTVENKGPLSRPVARRLVGSATFALSPPS